MVSVVIAVFFAVLAVISHADPILHGQYCNLCKDLVEEAEKLGEQFTEKWLKEKADKYCDKLEILAPECKFEVNKVIEHFVKHILEKETPEKVCKLVGFC